MTAVLLVIIAILLLLIWSELPARKFTERTLTGIVIALERIAAALEEETR